MKARIAYIYVFSLLLVASAAWAIRPVDIYTKSLAGGQNGVAYSSTVKAKFGTKPYTWSIGSGLLPTGLSIAAATGIISGTPTVNNTFNFVVHVVDSTGTPTTDDQSLYIVITGAAPAPTPAVSITTTSVPDGVVGGAYSTTLQATGGTAPYTWSIPASCVVPSCALPPAASLASSGVISGTLTAAGTYSFTARVTDSSSTPQTADRAFTATIAAGGAYLFSDGFESGNFSGWTGLGSGNGTYPPTVQSAVKHLGTYAYEQHYVICGDSTNSACGGSAQDLNRFIFKDTSDFGYPNGMEHIYIRGYFRLKTPEISEPGIGRKLYYFFSAPSALCGGVGCWQVGVAHGGNNQGKINVFTQGSKLGLPTLVYYDNGPVINFNQWYSLEIEILANTPGLSDGIITVWEDGVQIVQKTGLNLRASDTLGLKTIDVGEQVQRFNYAPIDEYRYWDDLVINTTGPIGP